MWHYYWLRFYLSLRHTLLKHQNLSGISSAAWVISIETFICNVAFVKRWLYHREFISDLQSSFIFSCLFHSFRLCHASHRCRLACQAAARVLMWRSVNTCAAAIPLMWGAQWKMREEIFVPSFFQLWGIWGRYHRYKTIKSGGVLPRAGMEIIKQMKGVLKIGLPPHLLLLYHIWVTLSNFEVWKRSLYKEFFKKWKFFEKISKKFKISISSLYLSASSSIISSYGRPSYRLQQWSLGLFLEGWHGDNDWTLSKNRKVPE